MERTEVHVGLHYVLPEEERDGWNRLPRETKATWRNAVGGLDQLDGEGQPSEYFVELTDEQIEAARAARNTKYVLPVMGVVKQGRVVEELDPNMTSSFSVDAVVEAEADAYHNLRSPSGLRGDGVVVFHLDTGCSDFLINKLGIRVVSKKNFVRGGADVTDVDGHGSMTMSLLHVEGAEYHIFKVLGDDGSGTSSGITQAIREAASIASADPSKKYILSGSLGGAPGHFFQPYHDACALAEEFGVLCRWSAGNDGEHAISAPANWTQGRASIAFDRKTDTRASFSNHEDWAGLSAVGQRIRVLDKNGNLAITDGTSFSLPLWNRYTTILACTFPGVSLLGIDTAEMSCCRDSGESIEEESHGVYDFGATLAKLGASVVPPLRPDYYPKLPRMSKTRFAAASLSSAPAAVLTAWGKEKGVYLPKEEN